MPTPLSKIVVSWSENYLLLRGCYYLNSMLVGGSSDSGSVISTVYDLLKFSYVRDEYVRGLV